MEPQQDKATNTGTTMEKFPISFSAKVWDREEERQREPRVRYKEASLFINMKLKEVRYLGCFKGAGVCMFLNERLAVSLSSPISMLTIRRPLDESKQVRFPNSWILHQEGWRGSAGNLSKSSATSLLNWGLSYFINCGQLDRIRAVDRAAGSNCHKWVMQKWEQNLLIIHEAIQS